jgi:hypothetical protein
LIHFYKSFRLSKKIMGHTVQVYIYDLSQGMGKTLGPALIGKPIEGIWHTGIVVYGKEYFFGSAGIESCPPAGTLLGSPLDVKELGVTEIPPEVFMDYLKTQSQSRFQGEKYNLFKHNCNNFSHETAQFLTGQGIPQHILDLPNEFLSTPMGQMIAPMIEQMTPSGQSIPFTMGDAVERLGVPEVSETYQETMNNLTNGQSTTLAQNVKVFPVTSPIMYNNPLNIEGMMTKVEQLNKTEEENALEDKEIKMFAGIAKGLVRLSEESFQVVEKILRWKEENRFPALDLLRHKCLHLGDTDGDIVERIAKHLVTNLGSGDTNAQLAAAALTNLVAKHGHSRLTKVDEVMDKTSSLLPSSHKKLEVHLTSLVHNLALPNHKDGGSLDIHVMLVSTILSSLHSAVQHVESEEKLLVSLGNILHKGQEEVTSLAHSMDAHTFVNKVEPRVDKNTVAEVKSMLKLE